MVFSGEKARREILYEEMHPYGTSAYRSADSTVEVSARRYRYTGKERDEETGLDYFGARYYAPWLGRWASADPLGLQAGLNLYEYVRGSPVVMVDPNGMDTLSWEEIRWRQRQPLPPPALQLTGENPKLYQSEHVRIERGKGNAPVYVAEPPDMSGMAQPSQGPAQEVPQPPGFERGHAEEPGWVSLIEEFIVKPVVGEAGAPTSEADVARQRKRIGADEFALNVGLLRLAFGRPSRIPGIKAMAGAERSALRGARVATRGEAEAGARAASVARQGPSKNIGGVSAEQAAELQRLLKRIPGVEDVYVFGSRTKGTWTPKSDLDIAAFGNVDPLSPKALEAAKQAQAYAEKIGIGTGKGHRPLDINFWSSEADMRASFKGGPTFDPKKGVPKLHKIE
jgi:RHS repeat-associated protein